MSERVRQIAEKLKDELRDKVLMIYEDKRGVVVRVEREAILEALALLQKNKDSPFDLLADEIGVDWLTWSQETGLASPPGRFSIYYNLYSLTTKERIFVEIYFDQNECVPSAVSLYASANWAERVIYDLFGIHFTDHPDLRRIYMTKDFEGYPLRKDFPRRGIKPQDHPQE